MGRYVSQVQTVEAYYGIRDVLPNYGTGGFRYYGTSGTFQVPNGVYEVRVAALGAGGGGAGTRMPAAGIYYFACGNCSNCCCWCLGDYQTRCNIAFIPGYFSPSCCWQRSGCANIPVNCFCSCTGDACIYCWPSCSGNDSKCYAPCYYTCGCAGFCRPSCASTTGWFCMCNGTTECFLCTNCYGEAIRRICLGGGGGGGAYVVGTVPVTPGCVCCVIVGAAGANKCLYATNPNCTTGCNEDTSGTGGNGGFSCFPGICAGGGFGGCLGACCVVAGCGGCGYFAVGATQIVCRRGNQGCAGCLLCITGNLCECSPVECLNCTGACQKLCTSFSGGCLYSGMGGAAGSPIGGGGTGPWPGTAGEDIYNCRGFDGSLCTEDQLSTKWINITRWPGEVILSTVRSQTSISGVAAMNPASCYCVSHYGGSFVCQGFALATGCTGCYGGAGCGGGGSAFGYGGCACFENIRACACCSCWAFCEQYCVCVNQGKYTDYYCSLIYCHPCGKCCGLNAYCRCCIAFACWVQCGTCSFGGQPGNGFVVVEY